jgi:hypothetical protein
MYIYITTDKTSSSLTAAESILGWEYQYIDQYEIVYWLVCYGNKRKNSGMISLVNLTQDISCWKQDKISPPKYKIPLIIIFSVQDNTIYNINENAVLYYESKSTKNVVYVMKVRYFVRV